MTLRCDIEQRVELESTCEFMLVFRCLENLMKWVSIDIF